MTSDQKFVSVISSMTGFHDPKKHRRLKAEDFLDLYQRRLYTSSKRIHAIYLDWFLLHRPYFLRYVVQHLLNKKRVL